HTCSDKSLAAVRILDRFRISDRAGAAIVSAALQDVGIISESNVLNVVDRNKIQRGRKKARTTLISQVIKDYDHDQFGLYFDGRKDRALSMEDNRRKVIIEEHISLVKEPGSEYIGQQKTIEEYLSLQCEDVFLIEVCVHEYDLRVFLSHNCRDVIEYAGSFSTSLETENNGGQYSLQKSPYFLGSWFCSYFPGEKRGQGMLSITSIKETIMNSGIMFWIGISLIDHVEGYDCLSMRNSYWIDISM
ncbi:hypothetical protein AVEN_41569-1, partial [Araneus ventricosus]